MTVADPQEEYRRRHRQQAELAAQLRQRERRVSQARMATFLTGLGVLIAGFEVPGLTPWLALLPAALFAVLIWYHESIIQQRQRAERAEGF
ncbi:MAG TPA: hypothetical protein VEB21_08370, partial [Terriglobales bacterium]|nr:hypothetical protein [Terriglobales bacterium]